MSYKFVLMRSSELVITPKLVHMDLLVFIEFIEFIDVNEILVLISNDAVVGIVFPIATFPSS